MAETLSRAVVLVAGTLYPAYRSYKAVRTKNVNEYVKWMMYWIVFALYQCTEALLDLFFAFWFPFYYQLKIVFVIWLLSPWTKGASILYRKWVHPALVRREKDIDALLDQAKSESYNQLVRIGSQSLVAARDIVATAALRGQAQLVQQLQKSYSANDVSVDPACQPERPTRRSTRPTKELFDVDERLEDANAAAPASDSDHDDDVMEGGAPSAPPAPRRSSRSRSRSRAFDPADEFPATIPRRSTRRV